MQDTKFIPLTDGVTQVLPPNTATSIAVVKELLQQDIEHFQIHHSIFIPTVFVRDVRAIIQLNRLT